MVDLITRRRLSVFSHIARLTSGVPARDALQLQVANSSGWPVDRRWKRPGRPRMRWVDQLRQDSGQIPLNLWREALVRGHGRATQRPSPAMR